jgi:hypothetical protein
VRARFGRRRHTPPARRSTNCLSVHACVVAKRRGAPVGAPANGARDRFGVLASLAEPRSAIPYPRRPLTHRRGSAATVFTLEAFRKMSCLTPGSCVAPFGLARHTRHSAQFENADRHRTMMAASNLRSIDEANAPGGNRMSAWPWCAPSPASGGEGCGRQACPRQTWLLRLCGRTPQPEFAR